MSNLKRPQYPMPNDIALALIDARLIEAYRARPDYQQNDYIAWITRAKRDETRQKRLQQMLQELKRGHLYMKMAYKIQT
jgi:uncharacterized protein YdeI (YjbR/CyaY-like superfamily)